jgi:molybdopterin-guanine dinucleotide biosynthesis protein A
MVTRGYVLAGGLSTRMGLDKGRLPFPGTAPMAAHVARQLRLAGLSPTIVRAEDDGPFIDEDGLAVRVITDGGGARHPLIGVAAALEDLGEGLALIVPCDLPWLDEAAIHAMIAPGTECVANDGARDHRLVVVLNATCAATCRALADADGPVRALVDGLPRVRLHANAMRNANAPHDLRG